MKTRFLHPLLSAAVAAIPLGSLLCSSALANTHDNWTVLGQPQTQFGDALEMVFLNDPSGADHALIGASGPSSISGAQQIRVYSPQGAYLRTLSSSVNGDKYGFSIEAIGDINLDGYNDIAVGAPFDQSGKVHIISGKYAAIGVGQQVLGTIAAPTSGERFGEEIKLLSTSGTTSYLAIGAPGYSGNRGQISTYSVSGAGAGFAAIRLGYYTGNQVGLYVGQRGTFAVGNFDGAGSAFNGNDLVIGIPKAGP
ncbi:MAG: FG-GAP repeat protein, partial [Bdellovibrionales bacterium]|nr:FG-GAP repeat protein [Bdellovibrionales bacterium]